MANVRECIENVGGDIEPEFGSGVAKCYEVLGNHQHLLNSPWTDEIFSQNSQQVQQPQAGSVVCKDKVLLREEPEVLGFIYIHYV